MASALECLDALGGAFAEGRSELPRWDGHAGEALQILPGLGRIAVNFCTVSAFCRVGIDPHGIFEDDLVLRAAKRVLSRLT